MSHLYEKFKAVDQPFLLGTTLIQASAGTGKTYSISYLVLRLIVECGLTIDQILTVTFTKAATEELKERIRKQLYDARKAYDVDSEDSTLNSWIELRRKVNELEQDKERLNKALSDIDEVGIFTIHGFCQRVLSEFPLESQQSFKQEMSQDLAELRLQVVHDFWRNQVYLASAQRIKWLMKVVESPAALMEWLDAIGDSEVTLVPDGKQLDSIWTEMESSNTELSEWFVNNGDSTLEWLKDREDKFKSGFDNWNEQYLDFLSYERFTRLLHGVKFRATKKQSKEDRIQEFWDEFNQACSPPTSAAEDFFQSQSALESSFKKELLAYFRHEMAVRQDQQGVIGFSDLILRLAEVLKSGGQHIKEAMQSRFKAALIDEFQDTDADQWLIFKEFFATGNHFLYLIGDPKQAIYKFRGADIETYLSAAGSADEKLTLATNWRSKPNLVKATNEIFSQDQVKYPFKIEALGFESVGAGRKYQPDEKIDTKPLMMWTWPESEEKLLAEAQKVLVCENVCKDILEQLQSKERVPSDFAVLVRSHAMAELYQRTLMKLAVPSVIKAKDSVFESDEATALWRLMRAILQPGRQAIAKEALSESIFGFNAHDIFEITRTGDSSFESFMLSLKDAHDTWHKKGFMPALLPFLEGKGVFSHLNQFIDAERRITNLLHCLEWLQQAALDESLTPLQTLHALEIAMNNKGADSTELRLESDEKSVQIVTIHASKGLQYPVVYCPDLYRPKKLNGHIKVYKVKHGNSWMVSADSSGKEVLKQDYVKDLEFEDLRLTYVALTRAEERCVVVMPPEPDSSSLSWLLPHGVPLHENIDQKALSLGVTLSDYCTYGDQLNEELLQNFTRNVDTRFRMTSYSGLIRGTLQEEETHKSGDEINDSNDKEYVRNPGSNSVLPKGAHFGNMLHDLFEYSDFSKLVNGPQHDFVLSLCRRYGVSEMIEAESDKIKDDHWTEFVSLVQDAVNAEISDGFSLKDLQPDYVLKEMPFFLALKESNTHCLNEVMQSKGVGIPYQPLSWRDLVGYLNGFVDLIAQHNDRFYVIDYKSNDLDGDYSQANMHKKMKLANYGLQGVLYSLALHRYLRTRMGDQYDFDAHFGGVCYLFVRGMSVEDPEQGVYRFNPSYSLIRSLDELLGGNV